MTATTQKTIAALNKLVATCKDGEIGYNAAAAEVADGPLKELLDANCKERAAFAAELLDQIHLLDVAEEHKGTTAGTLHRAWTTVEKSLTPRPTCTIVAECERGEHAALKAYEEALKFPWPEGVRAVVQKQYEKVKEDHDRVRGVKVIAALHTLEATCRDGEKGYRSAAADVTVPELKELFGRYAAQRAAFVAELRAEIHRLGDPAERGGTFAGMMHRGWMNARVAFNRRPEGGVIAECLRREEVALRHYKEARKEEFPAEVRAIVDKQCAAIEEARAWLQTWAAEHGEARK